MSLKFNKELSDRIFEIDKILRDPSLTEEEKQYYQQLKRSIWDTQTEELKEMREKFKEDLVKFCKENNSGTFGTPPIYNIFDPKEVKFYKKIRKWRGLLFRRL